MDSAEANFLLAMSIMLTTVICELAPIVEPNPISLDKPFTVYCDASRVQIEPFGVTNISRLQITRRADIESPEAEDVVAFYCATEVPDLHFSGSTIPPKRDWSITFSGRSGTEDGERFPNRHTMKIVVNVTDTKPDDIGKYRCYVKYYLPDGSQSESYKEETVIVGVIRATDEPAPEETTTQETTPEITSTEKTDPRKLETDWRKSINEHETEVPSAAGPGLGCGTLVIIVALCVVLLSDIHLRSPLPEAI